MFFFFFVSLGIPVSSNWFLARYYCKHFRRVERRQRVCDVFALPSNPRNTHILIFTRTSNIHIYPLVWYKNIYLIRKYAFKSFFPPYLRIYKLILVIVCTDRVYDKKKNSRARDERRYALKEKKKKDVQINRVASIFLKNSFVVYTYLQKSNAHARAFIARPSIATRIKGDCCHARYPRVATSRAFQGLEAKWAVVRLL